MNFTLDLSKGLHYMPIFKFRRTSLQREDYKILIADQDAEYRKTVQKALEEVFEHVAIAENGPQVLHLCSRTPYDLAIIDNRLQGMLGIEVVRRLEQAFPKMRRILTSSHDTDPVIDSALEYGMIDRFLQKPIGVKALVWEVEYLLGLRLEPPPIEEDMEIEEEDEEEDMAGNASLPFPPVAAKARVF